VHKHLLTLYAVTGFDGSRPNESLSRSASEDKVSRPGSSSRRTAGGAAYPGYLRGGSRSSAPTSSRPRTGESQMAASIQLSEAPFHAQPLPGDTSSANREHVGSSLTGQWYAHVRHMSDVK
jgi:hypothetical protein